MPLGLQLCVLQLCAVAVLPHELLVMKGCFAPGQSASHLITTAACAPHVVGGAGSGGSGKPPVSAKPFVPGGGSGRQPATGQPPRSPPLKPGRSGSRPGSQQGQGRAGTPDLPEGDDLLGMSAVTPGDARDVAAQAAEMFKSLNPFGGQQQAAPPAAAQQPSVPQMQLPPGGGRGRGGSARSSPRPGSAQGLGPPPPGFAPTTAAMATGSSAIPQPSGSSREGGWARPDSAGGRSGGAGGRGGRGGRGRRPGGNRPSAAYTTAPGRMQAAGQFISEQLRAELQQRSYLIQVRSCCLQRWRQCRSMQLALAAALRLAAVSPHPPPAGAGQP